MPSLRKDLRDKLEKTVIAARMTAEVGAREALAAIGVDQGKAFEHLKPAEKALRNQLRARGRQAGDLLDDRSGKQTIDHLVQMVGYEHWHRMLFARFLAENSLLLEPDNQVAVSLADVDELARDAKVDIWELAGRFAQRMLPAVFRADDPVLALTLAREIRTKLEKMLTDLPKEVFLADDSLGWTYQFWQTQRKEEVNKSGVKIGADELSPVTQLFTEDYMVDFLLHNTLGAWWAGKLGPIKAASEAAARAQTELPPKNGLRAITWTYLRFVKDEATQTWTPAAGNFSGWPKEAKKVTFLDPSMGSGHFVVFALPILARLRMEEEDLDAAGAVTAVLRDNIHGLELDERCTQIAAFNLALTAWKLAGYQSLPGLHLACSGLAPNASEAAWVTLAGTDLAAQNGMVQLYRLFKNAPVLGSLINPRAIRDELLDATFHELQPLLEEALAQETKDETAHEMAVTARGLAKAAEILAGQFTLVATNVPYLGRGNQDDLLKDYCERVHPDAKTDLATCFIERCLSFCGHGCSSALVTPQAWLFLGKYKSFRCKTLDDDCWNLVAKLGPHAFETIGGEVVSVALVTLTNLRPEKTHNFYGLETSEGSIAAQKSTEVVTFSPCCIRQLDQLANPDSRIIITSERSSTPLLEQLAYTAQGISTTDGPQFVLCWWELPQIGSGWEFFQTATEGGAHVGGCTFIICWEACNRKYHRLIAELKALNRIGGAWQAGRLAWNKKGLTINVTSNKLIALYSGFKFDITMGALIAYDEQHLPAIYCYLTSERYLDELRRLDASLSVTESALVKVPFDPAFWGKVAAEKYPNGLPKPFSSDPTQWLFTGHPKASDQPLQVAVARLLGYQWPRQTGSSFPDCPTLSADGLESHADADGIVCLSAVRGERTGADRLRTLLSASLGKFDEHGLIAATGSKATSLETWLRDDFFAEHCGLFHARPFIWHVWDGRADGFHALINYHKLAAPGGAGRKLLELLTFAYLGDWIKKQRDEQKKPGAEDRLIAAEALQHELKAILAGEPPCDIFVRWKPLHQQPVGWEPDLNDGVRVNIRPFLMAKDVARKGAGIVRFKPSIKWDKDRGKEPMRAKSDFPWFWGWDEATPDFTGGPDFDGNRWNDCHYTSASKRAARERHNK